MMPHIILTWRTVLLLVRNHFSDFRFTCRLQRSVDGSGGPDRPLVDSESCIKQNLIDGQRGHEAQDVPKVATRVHQKPLLEHAPPEAHVWPLWERPEIGRAHV